MESLWNSLSPSGKPVTSIKQAPGESVGVVTAGLASPPQATGSPTEGPCACLHALLILSREFLMIFEQGAPHFSFTPSARIA